MGLENRRRRLYGYCKSATTRKLLLEIGDLGYLADWDLRAREVGWLLDDDGRFDVNFLKRCEPLGL